MKVLAWDTSSKVGVLVALQTGQSVGPQADVIQPRIIAQMTLSVDTASHSERLLWAIHQCLAASAWTLADVDGFAVGAGPGSFTGLRIGITTARTLAHTLGKPLLCVSSLEALVRPMAQWLDSATLPATLVIGCTDACKGEFFGLWASAGEIMARTYEQRVLTSVELMDQLVSAYDRLNEASSMAARWIVLGEGYLRAGDVWKRLPPDLELKPKGEFYDCLSACGLAQVVHQAYLDPNTCRDPMSVQPNYLRASDAEVRLKAKSC